MIEIFIVVEADLVIVNRKFTINLRNGMQKPPKCTEAEPPKSPEGELKCRAP